MEGKVIKSFNFLFVQS